MRMSALGKFLGNGLLADTYRFWLKATNTVLYILLPICKLE